MSIISKVTNSSETDNHSLSKENGRGSLEASASSLSKSDADIPLADSEVVDADLARHPMAGGYDRAERDWHTMSKRTWQFSRLTAVFLFFAIMVGWPIGDLGAYTTLTGTFTGWSLMRAYPFGVIMFALVVPVMILFCGYVLSRAMTTTQAAEAMAEAARVYSTPDEVALREVETVGSVVRTQMDGLNAGLDDALMRLADAEAMIRKHVGAIETAGEAIELQATSAVDRVASERTKLIDATENLNSKADGFANAIAERTQANIVAMDEAHAVSSQIEERFGERLTGLENATKSALESFGQLIEALGGADENIRTKADILKQATAETIQATEQTKEATQAATLAAQEAQTATQQALFDASESTNQEIVQNAIAENSAKASEEALELARVEASKIAKEAAKNAVDTAVQNANLDIEKIAKEAGATLEKSTEERLEMSKEFTKEAESKKEELSRTHDALRKENDRLEKLIEEQKARAERLATAIAAQSESFAKMAEKGAANFYKQQEEHVEEVYFPGDVQEKLTEKKISITDTNKESGIDAHAEEEDLRLQFQQDKPPSLQPLKPAQLSGGIQTEPQFKKEEGVDFVEAVKTPRDDLARLSDLAKDLAQSRSGRVRNPHVATSDDTDKEGSSRKYEDDADRLNFSLVNNDGGNTENIHHTKENSSWKEILAAADGAQPLDLETVTRDTPLNLTAESKEPESEIISSSAEVIDLMPGDAFNAPELPEIDGSISPREAKAYAVIHRLQQFTLNLDSRLYGDCPPALIERFEDGDRNVFANRLLRLNEGDVKKRIRAESGKDQKFESDIREFLKQFDSLLEEAAQSTSVDEELREYLSSPLGRIYLLIGEIVGYFA